MAPGEGTMDDGEMIVEGGLTVRYVPARFVEGEWSEGLATKGGSHGRPAATPALAAGAPAGAALLLVRDRGRPGPHIDG
jgi:hypothetical protein